MKAQSSKKISEGDLYIGERRMTIGNTQMVARVNTRASFKPLSSVPLWMDLDKCHLFNPTTEEALF